MDLRFRADKDGHDEALRMRVKRRGQGARLTRIDDTGPQGAAAAGEARDVAGIVPQQPLTESSLRSRLYSGA